LSSCLVLSGLVFQGPLVPRVVEAHRLNSTMMIGGFGDDVTNVRGKQKNLG
jgi:hypothetical protein